jgi:hypothetical protein
MGCFASNLGVMSFFEAEITGFIPEMEFALHRIWIESDSSSVVQAFKKPNIIPLCLSNRWHNFLQLDINSVCSRIYHEGNCCADKLATNGYNTLG